MEKIKIGVAGANGAFGTKHLQALSAIEDVEVTAVMATSLNKANSVGDDFSVPLRFDDYGAFIASDNIDAVIILCLSILIILNLCRGFAKSSLPFCKPI